MVVAHKWTGTDTDRLDMRNLKLDQVLRVSTPYSKNDLFLDHVLTLVQRNFGRLAMFGFSTTLLCTSEVTLMYDPSLN
jgi:hypothetical protein